MLFANNYWLNPVAHCPVSSRGCKPNRKRQAAPYCQHDEPSDPPERRSRANQQWSINRRRPVIDNPNQELENWSRLDQVSLFASRRTQRDLFQTCAFISFRTNASPARLIRSSVGPSSRGGLVPQGTPGSAVARHIHSVNRHGRECRQENSACRAARCPSSPSANPSPAWRSKLEPPRH